MKFLPVNVNMHFFPNMHVQKKMHVSTCMLTWDFFMLTWNFLHVNMPVNANMLFFPNMHVDMVTCMLTWNFLHVNMQFFLNMHVQKKSHVDMQKISCQDENHMSTCKSHVNMQHLFLMPPHTSMTWLPRSWVTGSTWFDSTGPLLPHVPRSEVRVTAEAP